MKRKERNHVEVSVSSECLEFVSSATSVVDSSFGISTFEVFDISCVVSDCSVGVVDRTGEFRCCSSSYSLIKRFLSECVLFDELAAVGDGTIGGVLLVLTGGLFKLDE
jgi:hypothetical protein